MRFKEVDYVTRILRVTIIIKTLHFGIAVCCLLISNVFLKDSSSITGMKTYWNFSVRKFFFLPKRIPT